MTKKDSFLRKPIEVLFEDEYYVIFNKPANLIVVPSPKNENNTLVNIVNYQFSKVYRKDVKLYPCHRLDRETSGTILFAKSKRVQKLMMDVFKKREVTKQYVAFIHGRLKKSEGQIKTAIKSLDARKYNKTTPAKTAITLFETIEQREGFSIIKVRIVTGRTNQIRIHFSKVGHPLVGDRKYAFARDYDLKFRRTALHSSSLEFDHPQTHKRIKVEAALPEDMKKFLENH